MDKWSILKNIKFLFSLLQLASSFNIDTDYPVKKQGKSGTYFGFAVAEHQVSASGKVENWLLVSAPKSNSSGLPAFQETGAVFKCSAVNGTTVCKDEVIFDKRRGSTSENKNYQWFGVSLKSSGADQSVLACAHRAMYYGPGDNYNLLEGKCRSMDGDLQSSGDFFNPCRGKIATKQVPSFENYGQCQTGIGIDIVKGSQTSFLFGSVGVENFAGATFRRTSDKSDAYVETEKIGGMELSYFGYSVAHGNFLSTARKDIATGGPRSDSTGKVIIYMNEASKLKVVLSLPSLADKVQLASAFGFAVCAYHIKNDEGYAYLLVGAPFHQNEAAEEGMVYVYMRSGEKSMKLVQKLTVKNSRANFGSAIIAAGDLDLDGFNDFVVGAPYEDNMAGAVYVFEGTSKGPGKVFSQRIAASQVDSKLRAFGRSMAGGMDMDSNGYNDILVGAYLSDQAVLLRSRPVLKIIASIETDPVKINPDDYKYPNQTFRIVVSYRYEEKSKRLTANARATIRLTIDPGRTPRIKFRSEDTNVVSATISVSRSKRYKRFWAYLVRDKGKFQSYPDVNVDMKFSLVLINPTVKPDEVLSLDKRPVLESHLAGSKLENVHSFDSSFVEFKRDCDPCIPDLSVVANENLTIRLGKLNVELAATIKNNANATAFQTDLGLVLPPGISVSLIKLSDGDVRSCDDAIPYVGGKTQTLCKNLFTELKPKKSEKIYIVLDTKKLDANIDDKSLTLNVTSANKEVGTEADNIFSVNLEVIAEADLMIQGTPITRREFYGGKIRGESSLKIDSEIGHVLYHRYFATNNGPDRIPNAVITIYWPTEAISGKHLLYLMSVESTGEKCKVVSGKLNELGLETSIGSTVSNDSSVGSLVSGDRLRRDVSSSSPSNGKQNTTSKANPNKPPVGGSGSVANKDKSPKIGSKTESRVLDCFTNTAKCAKIVCKTNVFASRQGISIIIKSRIWNSTLLMDYKGETVTVVSHASIAIGSNASYITDPDLRNNKASVSTILYPETPKSVKERVAVWKIVLAVLAGIILLALLIFGLYKLGFFKRTDKSTWKKNRKALSKENQELLDKKPISEKK